MILGLGDTNYSNFGAHPKKIEKKLVDMGASLMIPTVVADEVEGLEGVVDPWIEKCISTLSGYVSRGEKTENGKPIEEQTIEEELSEVHIADKQLLPLPYDELATQKELTGLSRVPASLCVLEELQEERTGTSWLNHCEELKTVAGDKYSQAKPFLSKITKVACLTTTETVKRTLLLELDIQRMNWNYRPGDALGIHCPNPILMVDNLQVRLKPYKSFNLKPVDAKPCV
jgi:sulfite reductase alpha subunit-like flavoprotein